MVCAAVLKLCGGDINQPLPCPVRNKMDKSKQILTGIPESHAAPDPGFKVGGGTAHVESDHTLILVPYIDHPVQFLFVGGYGKAAQKIRPVVFELFQCQIGFFFRVKSCHQLVCAFPVDPAFFRAAVPFFFHGIFYIPQKEYISSGFAGSKGYFDMVRSDRRPSAGDRVFRLAFYYAFRSGIFPVSAEKCIPVCIISVDRSVYRIDCIMIPAFPVFGLVKDG